jgi:hypothetical protein
LNNNETVQKRNLKFKDKHGDEIKDQRGVSGCGEIDSEQTPDFITLQLWIHLHATVAKNFALESTSSKTATNTVHSPHTDMN